MGLLEESRIPVSLLSPEALIEAAREREIDLEELAERTERDALSIPVGERMHDLLASALDKAALVSLWVHIPFTMQMQQQTQWCWSATAVSLSHYYSSSSTWTQCGMVNEEMGQTTCCTDGSSDACNQPNVLDSPLDRAGVLARWQGGSVDYATIQAEVDAARPLAWRIGWSGGGGHFAVIDGYRTLGGEWVAVDDPWYGASDVEVASLNGGTYQGTGTWTHTYFTKRPLRMILPLDVVRIPTRWWEQVRVRQEALAGEGGG